MVLNMQKELLMQTVFQLLHLSLNTHNSPIIIKDKYAINGSDTAQIGWVEVSTEEGTGGFLWYLKAESETRLRFEDY
jgi:hypothetical protein